MNNKNRENSLKLAEVAIRGIQEVKGLDIKCLDLRKIPHAVSDFFIVCHGSSNVHAEALGQSVEDEVRKTLEEKPWHREGMENAQWILLDYVSVVVHIFQKESREFYALEDLWADAIVQSVEGEEEVDLQFEAQQS